MGEIDNGGSAYPVQDDEKLVGGYGMTLLDWFAGQVLTGTMIGSLLTAPIWNKEAKERKVSGEFLLAESVYKLAEAMIAEKRKREVADNA